MAIKSEIAQMSSSFNQNDPYQPFQSYRQQQQQPTLPPYLYSYDNNRAQDELIHALNPNTISPTDTITYTSNNNNNSIHIKSDEHHLNPPIDIIPNQAIITSLVPQINQHANYPYLQNNIHNNDIFNSFNTNNNRSYAQPFGPNHNNNNTFASLHNNQFMLSGNSNQFSSSQHLYPNNIIIPTATHVTNCINNMVNEPKLSLQKVKNNVPNLASIINEINNNENHDKKQRVKKKKKKKKIICNDDKPFECLTCGKRYKHLCNFRSHSKIHTDNAYICEYCNKKFGRKANMEEHRRVHTGESPFICKFCNRKFKQRHGWKDHVRTHTKNKIYLCSECNKEFDAGYKLHNHMRIHNPKKKK